MVATSSVALTLLGIGTTPAQAALFNFQFEFNAQETGEQVSGNFVFDNLIEPIVVPDGGNAYQNASPNFSINVGEDVFEGSSNTVAVGDNLVNPDGSITDSIVFDDFNDFEPLGENRFLATFAYPSDSLSSGDLSALPNALPSSAVAIINTPTRGTLSAANASTTITSVPEPASTAGVLTLCALGTGSLLKRKRQKKT